MALSDKQEEPSYFISDLMESIKKRITFLMAHWSILLIMGTFGGLLGLGYAFIKKDTYTAATTFVVEDNPELTKRLLEAASFYERNSPNSPRAKDLKQAANYTSKRLAEKRKIALQDDR